MKRRVRLASEPLPIKNPKPSKLFNRALFLHNIDMNYLRGNITYKEFNRMYDILNELYDFYERLQNQEKKQN